MWSLLPGARTWTPGFGVMRIDNAALYPMATGRRRLDGDGEPWRLLSPRDCLT
jgi:hypothetical protein